MIINHFADSLVIDAGFVAGQGIDWFVEIVEFQLLQLIDLNRRRLLQWLWMLIDIIIRIFPGRLLHLIFEIHLAGLDSHRILVEDQIGFIIRLVYPRLLTYHLVLQYLIFLWIDFFINLHIYKLIIEWQIHKTTVFFFLDVLQYFLQTFVLVFFDQGLEIFDVRFFCIITYFFGQDG